MLKYDLSAPLTDLNGTPYKAEDGHVTLGSLAIAVLTAVPPQDKASSAADKVKYARMALKVNDALTNDVPVEMTPEDVTMLKTRVGEFCEHVVLVMRAHDLLDGGAVVKGDDSA